MELWKVFFFFESPISEFRKLYLIIAQNFRTIFKGIQGLFWSWFNEKYPKAITMILVIVTSECLGLIWSLLLDVIINVEGLNYGCTWAFRTSMKRRALHIVWKRGDSQMNIVYNGGRAGPLFVRNVDNGSQGAVSPFCRRTEQGWEPAWHSSALVRHGNLASFPSWVFLRRWSYWTPGENVVWFLVICILFEERLQGK